MDGHHFGVHRERSVRLGTASTANLLESDEIVRVLPLLLLVFLFRFILLALLQLRLHICQGGSIESAVCDAAVLENSAVEAGTIIVVTLANDLAAANDDTAMAVVEGRFGGLLEAKREVIVRLHCDCLAG